MKKMFILFILFGISTLFAQDSKGSFFERSYLLRGLRINLQANALQSAVLSDSSGNRDCLLGNSFSVGLEFRPESYKGIDYGFGIFYQSNSTISGTKDEIGVVPIYSFIDYPLTRGSLNIKLSLRLGYGFIHTKNSISQSDNGLYHAMGFTMEPSENIQIKIMYSNNYGKILINGNEYALRNGNMNIVLNFGL